MRLILLAVVPLSLVRSTTQIADGGSSDAEACCYMPRGSWSTEPAADQRDRAFVTSILMLMSEERLQERRSPPDQTYRCLYLTELEHSTLVRADRRGEVWQLTFKQLSGTGGYADGELIRNTTRSASSPQAAVIRRAVQGLRLDGLARPEGGPPAFLHADLLALESVVDGEYRIRFEEFPNERGSGGDLRAACWRLLCATGQLADRSKLLRALDPSAGVCPKWER